jgi:hypothetical protein
MKTTKDYLALLGILTLWTILFVVVTGYKNPTPSNTTLTKVGQRDGITVYTIGNCIVVHSTTGTSITNRN